MKRITKMHPTKILTQVRTVELSEDGAYIVLTDDKKIYLSNDQVVQVWGMLTLAMDAAVFGQLSSKIRRLGIYNVMQSALQGIRCVREDERQARLPMVDNVAIKVVEK